jgi:thiol-disulfide isomerase/thioredoxin
MIRSPRAVVLLTRTLVLAALLGPGAAPALDAGEAAPAFSAPRLGAQGSISLDQHQGKVIYLDFWASWCPPCLTAMPVLDELQREFGPRGFEVVAVNLDRDPEQALRFLASRPVGYASGSDPAGELPRRFGVATMPTSFLIDRSGIVRHVHEGFRRSDAARIREQIRALVAEGE